MFVPRPLHVKSSAPAAREPTSGARVWRRSSSALAPSRTWKRSVWPTRIGAPTVFRLVLVDHEPDEQPCGRERALPLVERQHVRAEPVDGALPGQLVDDV